MIADGVIDRQPKSTAEGGFEGTSIECHGDRDCPRSMLPGMVRFARKYFPKFGGRLIAKF